MAIRSFVGLELNEEVRRNIIDLMTELRRTKAPVKWVEPENLHLTLKFLGDVPEDLLDAVKATLHSVAQGTPEFSFRVEGTGGFPNLRRPRVLWVGVVPETSLMRLQESVETALKALGFPREDRPFHPHITLGRVKRPVTITELLRLLGEYRATAFGVVPATYLTLFRSDLSPQGPTYTPLGRFPFRPDPMAETKGAAMTP